MSAVDIFLSRMCRFRFSRDRSGWVRVIFGALEFPFSGGSGNELQPELNVFVNQKVAKSLDSWPGFMDPGLDFKCRILPRQKWNVKCKFFTDSVWRALRWKALPVFPLLSRVWQWRLRQSYPSPLHLIPAKKSVKFVPLPFLLKEKKKKEKHAWKLVALRACALDSVAVSGGSQRPLFKARYSAHSLK